MKSSTYNYIMNSNTYNYIMNSRGCIVYRIRNRGLDCVMYLNKKLNNQLKQVKFYFNYFKYLTYFKQLFKKYCLILLDIKFKIY